MKKMMRKILFFVLILLLINNAHAILYSTKAIKQEGNPGEQLVYNITISNNENITRNLQFTFLDWPLSSFSPSYLVTLEPGETKELTLTITIPKDITPNLRYYLTIFVSDYLRKDITERIAISASVILTAFGKINVTEILAPREIDPRNEFSFNVVISNVYEPSNITLIVKILNSTEPFTEPIYSSTIRKGINTGNTTVVFSNIKLADDQKPGDYFITSEIYYGTTLLSNLTQSFKVIGYANVISSFEERSTLFERSVKFYFFNNGTKESGETTFTKDVSTLDLILLKSIEGNGEKVIGGIRWIYNVPAGKTVELGYTVSYLPVLILPFIILALIYTVYYMNRKMIVEKEVVEVHKVDHAFSFKIILKVKNVSFSTFKEIVIQEVIPQFVSSVGGFGSIEARIVRKLAHRNMIWEIDELRPGDEISLSYKMKTKLHILGKINLPCARVKFVDQKGRKYEMKSNTLSFEVISKV